MEWENWNGTYLITGTVSYLVMIVHAGQVSPALVTSDFYQSLQRDIFLLNPQVYQL